MWSESTVGRRAPVRQSPLLIGVATFLLVAIAGELSLRLQSDGIGAMWPVAGISGGLLLASLDRPVARRVVLVAVSAGLLLINLLESRPWPAIAIFVVANMGEALLFAISARTLIGMSRRLDSLSKVGSFLLAGTAVPAAVGILVAIGLKWTGYSESPLLNVWWLWFSSHTIGLVTLGPFFLLLPSFLGRPFELPTRDIAPTIGAAVLSLVVIGALVPETSVFMLLVVVMLVPLAWWVLQGGNSDRATVALALVAVVTIILTTGRAGLFAGNLLASEVFLTASAVGLLLLGALPKQGPLGRVAGVRLKRELSRAREQMILVPLVLFVALAWWAWRGVEVEARNQAIRTSEALAIHAQRVVEVQETMLEAMLASVEGKGPDEIEKDRSVHALLRHLEAQSATSQSMVIVRADTGKAVALGAEFPVRPLDLSGRDYVVTHRETNRRSAIGEFRRGPVSQALGFTVSRMSEDGKLIAGSLVSVDEFHKFYASQAVSPDDYLALVRDDGAVLAIRTSGEGEPHSVAGDMVKSFAEREHTQPKRIVMADGVARLVVLRRVGIYPLYVTYGLATSRLLTQWLSGLVPVGLITLLGAVLLQLLSRRVEASADEAALARSEASIQRAIAELRGRSEERLRESHQTASRLAAIVQSSSDAIMGQSLDGAVTSWNKGAEALFGYTEEEMLGQSLRRIIPLELQHEEDRFLALIADGQAVEDYETVRICKDGRRVQVSVSVSPLRDEKGKVVGTSKIARDITERHRLEAEVRASERRFRGVFEHAGTGIGIADFRGQLTQCNPAFTQILGYGDEELTGKHLAELAHPNDRLAFSDMLNQLAKSEIEEIEVVDRSLRRDGSTVWLHRYVSLLLDEDGKASGYLSLITDMTAQRRAEERQHLLMRELAHRGKNLLAVVQSIANRSFAGTMTLSEARAAFRGRIQALSRTYGSLTDEGFEGAPLMELIKGELDAFVRRATISGPAVVLSARAAQTLALVVHELATNAAKYGSLSIDPGHLYVIWDVTGEGSERRFSFEWRERHGPPARAPTECGFGTTLISGVVAAEFRCKPELVYGEDGFTYRFETALGNVGRLVHDSPLRSRINSTALLSLYDLWHEAKGAKGEVPPYEAFDRKRLSGDEGLTVVKVGKGESLEVLEVGRSLVEYRDGEAHEWDVAGEDPRSAPETYRRCARQGLPSYEHLRMEFGKGQPMTFERLLAPYLDTASGDIFVVGIAALSGNVSAGRHRSGMRRDPDDRKPA